MGVTQERRRVTIFRRRGPEDRRADDLEERLRREIEGEVHLDRFARGRYATDASIYEIHPLGVVVPKSMADLEAVLTIARETGTPLLMRGGGTSQAGQTVGRALVVDTSKHLSRLLHLDAAARTAVVEPGLVLDELNRRLKPSGLFFPVDVSTASRATLGGMAANNSAGSRSIRYGIMVHQVRSITGWLADGTACRFGPTDAATDGLEPAYRRLVEGVRSIAASVEGEIQARFPKVLRRVGGYNLDTIDDQGHNMASLLVGSEGTLAVFRELELELQPLRPHRVMGVCRFPSFRKAMEAAAPLVTLGPDAVELVDRSILELARAIEIFRPTIDRLRGPDTDCLLIVELAGEERQALERKLDELEVMMADLGHPGGVVRAVEPEFQAAIAEVRRSGLNIVMSMKGDAKPASFIEDCAVPLERLADYTAEVEAIFARYRVQATWYAHASVGCLHVRPVLNLRRPDEVARMRAIAEAVLERVRHHGGSHSGEHGDGLVRSSFHRAMLGARLVLAFEQVKDLFDPQGLLNPGKIVRAPPMDDQALMRTRPTLGQRPDTVLDWSAHGSLLGAAEMCNNNGECRKASGVMCPSFRATGDEEHVVRGRANTLRLALLGRLGPDALTSPELARALDLCLACKACARECPTGVDMARMKIEVTAQRRLAGVPLGLRERLIAYLPRYAPLAGRWPALANAVQRYPGLRAKLTGFAADRPLPRWSTEPWRPSPPRPGAGAALFVDCFNAWFEPENARAATRVLGRLGLPVTDLGQNGRPVCCGRTFLAQGLIEQAREEACRFVAAARPALEAGLPIVGLEPSCVGTLRQEFRDLIDAGTMAALERSVRSFAEQLALLELPRVGPGRSVLLHAHCHQRAQGLDDVSRQVLRDRLGVALDETPPACCGMAGSFGYEAEKAELSRRIAEQGPLPKVRAAAGDALIVADGTSCRHQFADLAGREAVHLAVAVEQLLAAAE